VVNFVLGFYMKFKKIAIIGVGLIGGSFGMCIKKKRIASEVMGIGRNLSRLNKAVKLRAIDRATIDMKEGVKGADIVFISVPVKTIPVIVKKILPFLKKGCIITDAGSTKAEILKEIEKMLSKNINFVAGHPIAGSENQGAGNARPDLFKNAFCVLTPGKRINKSALKQIINIWKRCGAKIMVMDPKEHDRILSATSHIPHIAAIALMHVFSDLAGIKKEAKLLIGGGFRDTTRIAASSAEMWKDIFETNSIEVLKALTEFKRKITKIESLIKNKDFDRLNKILKHAKEVREAL
jgi:prephenate dehydrogenase